jgi:hypothetical protein
VKPETPEERGEHERACLDEVRRQAYESSTLARDGTTIHAVRLAGSYPGTRIEVDVQRLSRRDVLEWKLWDEGDGDFGEPAPGGMPAPPAIVAREIMIVLYEF